MELGSFWAEMQHISRYVFTTKFAKSSMVGLVTHKMALLAMLFRRKASSWVSILMVSVMEKGMPRHL